MTHTTMDEFKHGWPTLLASSVGIASGLSGLAFYTFGVFIVPLEEAFGWTRGDLSIASSFLIIGTAITAPIIGTIIDKYGARRVGLWSTFALSLGYFALTQLQDNIMAFYAAWLAIALVGGGTTPVVWTRAINIWFDRGRGLALGLTLGGSGLSGIFGPILCTALIAAYGWQGGYVGLGLLIMLVALPVLYLMFKDHDRNPTEPSDQASQVEQRKPASSLAGLTLHESLRSPPFWIIAGGFFVVSGTVAGLIINIVPMLIDRGLTAQGAAGIAGTLGIAVVFGRVGIGFLLDRFRAALIARILLALTAAGCFLLTLEDGGGLLTRVAVLSLGFAAAAEVDLVAYLTSRYFGMKSYGKIYGWQTSAFYLGAAVGPILVGVTYDAFNGYDQVLYTACGLLLLGALVVGSLGKPPKFDE